MVAMPDRWHFVARPQTDNEGSEILPQTDRDA